jgi:hypothetical protein
MVALTTGFSFGQGSTQKLNPSSRKNPWFHNSNQPSFAKRKRREEGKASNKLSHREILPTSLVATFRRVRVVLFSVVIPDGIVCWLRARTVWVIQSVLVWCARREYVGFDFLPGVGDVA